MSERILTFWLLILFLFPHGLFSKSATKSEYTIESGSLIKSDADQTAIEDNPGLHDSLYRPRHKYKTDSGSQARFYRSEMDGEKELEVKIPQCAVMYKNSEPVGILQPYEDTYRFLQVSGEPTLVDINPIPVKRKTIMDVLYPSRVVDEYDDQSLDNTAQFTDERYPSIFAKFKIDSRLDKSLNPDIHLKRSMHKRGSDKSAISEVAAPASQKSGVVKKADEGMAVEDELKTILDDMGLIDDYSETKEEIKREVEDENLELGTNKISLVKEENKDKRDKREDQNAASTMATTATTSFLSKKSISPMNSAVASKGSLVEETHNEEEKENHVEEERSVDMVHPNENSKLEEAADSDVSTEKEAADEEMRKKRNNEKKDNKDSKRSAFSSSFEFTTSTLVKEAELTEYEKRVEREIRDKIEKLKSEVKKEISELKQNDAKNKKESFAEDTKRKKRQVVNTLLDEESVDINPLVSGDDKNKIHIRRKREADFDKQFLEEPKPEEPIELKQQDQTLSPSLLKEELKILDDLQKSQSKNDLNLHVHQDIVKDASSVTEDQMMSDEKKSFIGINPVLENDTGQSYRIRTLKQHNEDENLKESGSKIHVSLKREYNKGNEEEKNEADARKKRDADEGVEEDAYQDDESEFNEDVSYDSLKSGNSQGVNENVDADSGQIGNAESNQYTGTNYGCKCDKTGGGCKCGSSKLDLNIPSFKQEESSNSGDSMNLLEKKSIGQHCNCGKNDNHCKCGHTLDDLPASPFKRDNFLSNPQSISKTSVEEKDSADDLQVDSQANFPRRIKERRNVKRSEETLTVNEAQNSLNEAQNSLNEAQNSLNEDHNENYLSEKSSFIKRDTKARKFSASRPFKNGEYFVDLHPDIYRLSPSENSREKRDNFELIAIHGDTPIRKHMVAIRERSAVPHPRIRRRVLADDDKQPRQLIDMSDEDLFGALPQSYAGELARYKRVKRTKTKK